MDWTVVYGRKWLWIWVGSASALGIAVVLVARLIVYPIVIADHGERDRDGATAKLEFNGMVWSPGPFVGIASLPARVYHSDELDVRLVEYRGVSAELPYGGPRTETVERFVQRELLRRELQRYYPDTEQWLQEGFAEVYWRDGSITSGYHSVGAPDGAWETRARDGRKRQEDTYMLGQLVRFRRWHSNGQLAQEVFYENGEEREFTEWDENGAVTKRSSYEDP